MPAESIISANPTATFALVHATHPCTELVLDENQIRGYLLQAGWREVPSVETADLAIVATCAFNQDYEDDAAAAITRTAVRIKPGAKVVVAGCFPAINRERFAALGAFATLTPREMEKLEQLVPSPARIGQIETHSIDIEQYRTNRLFMLGITLKKIFRAIPGLTPPAWLDTVPMTDWYFVRGAVGCTGSCSYCAIRHARGPVRSAPLETVVAQVRTAVAQGHRVISLAGDDMGCYGIDRGTDLPTLLEELVRIPGDFEINLRFVEPRYLIAYFDRLLKLFATGRITTFCAPIQSGSPRILAAMNKDFAVDDAVAAINGLLRSSRLRSISSNLMVGFPGETLDDWLLSYRLLETCDINMYQVLIYQDRPGTPSSRLPDKVPPEIQEHRRRRFVTKMQMLKFAGFSARTAERWTRLRHGPHR